MLDYAGLYNRALKLADELDGYTKLIEEKKASCEKRKSDIKTEYESRRPAKIAERREEKKNTIERDRREYSEKLDDGNIDIKEILLEAVCKSLDKDIVSLDEARDVIEKLLKSAERRSFLENRKQRELREKKADILKKTLNILSSADDMEKDFSTMIASVRSDVANKYNDAWKIVLEEIMSLEKENSEQNKNNELDTENRKIKYEVDQATADLKKWFEKEIISSGFIESYNDILSSVPDARDFNTTTVFPEGITYGSVRINLYDTATAPEQISFIDDALRDLIKRNNYHYQKYIDVPYGRSFSENISKQFFYDLRSKKKTAETLNSVILQLLMSVPCHKVHFTLIDPLEAGASFAKFGTIKDIDAKCINIVREENDIERYIINIEREIASFANSLVGYENIIDYNKAAGEKGKPEMAQPFHVIVVMDFPNRFTKPALSSLLTIVSTGDRCGVYTILAGDKDDSGDSASYADYEKICELMKQYGRITIAGKEDTYSVEIGGRTLQYIPKELPRDVLLDNAINEFKSIISEPYRITIHARDIYKELIKNKSKWFFYEGSDSTGIEIPIGEEGISKSISIHLGGDYSMSHHILVIGMTGSGKSNLLRTIIMNTLLKYKPEDVQFYLLDFKEGVEFARFAKYKLKNFRVIATDTEKEFGLCVLNELRNEYSRRMTCFKDHNVYNIEEYNKTAQKKMPRLVLIFDEFQELFNEPDNQICIESKSVLTNLAAQGRNAGIHLILATQNVAQATVLDQNVFKQFKIRILFSCEASSAQQLLSADNPAVSTIINRSPGQALFNDAMGDKKNNKDCQIVLYDSEDEFAYLKEIAEKQEELFPEMTAAPRLLISSVQDDPHNILNKFVNEEELPETDLGAPYRLYIGESLAMKNTFKPSLSCNKGENMLMIGMPGDTAALLSAYVCMSLIVSEIQNELKSDDQIIDFVDFTAESDHLDILYKVRQELPSYFRVIHKDSVITYLQMMKEEIQQAKEEVSGYRRFMIFFGLNRAKALVDDDILNAAFEHTPKEDLEYILKEGPTVGVNSIIWADNVQSYMHYFNNYTRYFNFRLAHNLDDNDAFAILNETIPHDMSELNLISYCANESNEKIRIYKRPTDEWISRFIERARTSRFMDGRGRTHELEE